jgi:signal recognition particle subunit SEC65
MKINSTSLAITIMLLLGAVSLIVSIGYNSSVLAFIGLGLVFWGAILFYVRPEEYTKRVIMEAVLSPSLTALCQMIRELGYKGDPTYLPPKYFADPETTKIYISKYKRRKLPTPEQAHLYETWPLTRATLVMLITPPGIELSRLLEKSLGTSFVETDLKDLEQNLPKLFIENLEIAENLELQAESDVAQRKEDDSVSPNGMKREDAAMESTMVHAKITKPVYRITFKVAEESSQTADLIGDPICSAIAIAITKATGKPVRITDTKRSEDGSTLEANYKILEE